MLIVAVVLAVPMVPQVLRQQAPISMLLVVVGVAVVALAVAALANRQVRREGAANRHTPNRR